GVGGRCSGRNGGDEPGPRRRADRAARPGIGDPARAAIAARHTAASRESYNLAVYRDQLAEIDRDAARGLLNPEQAEVARAEIGRRILALQPGAVRLPMPPPQSSPASGGGSLRGIAGEETARDGGAARGL